MLRVSLPFTATVVFVSAVARAESPGRTPIHPSAEPSDTRARADGGAEVHEGFYLREASGLAYGSLGADGPAGRTQLVSDNPLNNGLLLIGGTPWPGAVIGGGFRAMSASGSFVGGPYDGARADAQEATLGPFVDWYPDPSSGWHLGMLAGVSGTLVQSTTNLLSAGFGATVFGGFDWWVARQWSLGVIAAASGAKASSLVDSQEHDTGYRVSVVDFGIHFSVAYH